MKCSFCGADNEMGASVCKVCQKPLINTDESNSSVEKEEPRRSYFTTHAGNGQESNVQNLAENNVSKVASESGNNFSDEKVMQEPTVMISSEEMKNYDISNNDGEKKKGNKALVIGIICAVVIFVIGLVIGLVFLLNPSPSKIFKASTNKLFDALEENSKIQSNGFYNTNINITPMIELKGVPAETLEMLEMINSLKIKVSHWADLKNNKMDFSLGFDYKDKQIIDFEVFYDKEAYMLLDGLLPYPVKAECKGCESLFNASKDDIEDARIILRAYNEALNGALKDSYFERDKEEITLNGKKYNATVSKLKLNDETVSEISKSILGTLSKNGDFVKAYARFNGIDEREAKEQLETAASSTVVSDNEDMDVILYTTGFNNEFLMVELESNGVVLGMYNGSKKDEYILKVNYQGNNLSFKVDYSMTDDKNVSEPDVSGAKTEEEISKADMQNALNKIFESEGYKALNDDFKAFSGYSFEELINLMMIQGNSNYNGNLQGSEQITSDFFNNSDVTFY